MPEDCVFRGHFAFFKCLDRRDRHDRHHKAFKNAFSHKVTTKNTSPQKNQVAEHTVVNETDSDQGLQIYAPQGSPGNLYLFLILEKKTER